MIKKFTLLACILCASTSLFATPKTVAKPQVKDSVSVRTLDEVEVVATRASEATPIAFTNISSKELTKNNSAQDIPFLLSLTPSVLTTSDNGTGIGYTTMRVRGTDPTRINITVNGVPMNDAESSSVYFVNMPDFASSLKDVQIQRGVGTSTNGFGAFGASVNMKTQSLSFKPYTTFQGGYGSFNTHKESIRFGTGLLNEHWSLDGRLSNIGTDGYINRASVDLNSYFLQVAYYAGNTSIRLLTFNGQERTYHAWDYASKEDMETYGRTYNSCGEYLDLDGNTHYYDDQVDQYHQQNYQLLLTQTLSPTLYLKGALHYTKGDGYYEQYKSGRTLSDYNLQAFTIHTDMGDSLYKKSDLVRRKMMENDFGGAIVSLHYKNFSGLRATLGGGMSKYSGDHFGRVIWVKNYAGDLLPNHEYYNNTGEKIDANIYLKADYRLNDALSFWGDMQYRHVNYTMSGLSDTYDWITSGMVNLDLDKTFDFLNPKFGLNYQISKHQRAFASVSVAHKEPTRDNYKDVKDHELPTAEQLIDYEMGYNYRSKNLSVGLNAYYMDYKDQLVQTGETNSIGEPISTNMPESYRAGLEFMFNYNIVKGLNLNANATWSKNIIKNYEEILYNDYVDPITVNHKNATIAYSPSFLTNAVLSYTWHNFDIDWQAQYVDKQYMTNTNDETAILDAYFVNNLNVNYSFSTPGLKKVTLGLTVYNILNEEYENNGWAGRSYHKDNGTNIIGSKSAYAAQADTHFMGHITINF